MVDLVQRIFNRQTTIAMKGYLRNQPLFQSRMLATLNRTTDTLHALPNPLSLSAEITKNTKGIHDVQN